jgi:hypothetical protein
LLNNDKYSPKSKTGLILGGSSGVRKGKSDFSKGWLRLDKNCQKGVPSLRVNCILGSIAKGSVCKKILKR